MPTQLKFRLSDIFDLSYNDFLFLMKMQIINHDLDPNKLKIKFEGNMCSTEPETLVLF